MSVPINCLGIIIAIKKIITVKSAKTNKSYSLLSILMLYQVILGMLGAVIAFYIFIYYAEVESLLGRTIYDFMVMVVFELMF
jgi:hypothetical protein